VQQLSAVRDQAHAGADIKKAASLRLWKNHEENRPAMPPSPPATAQASAAMHGATTSEMGPE